MYVYAWSRVLAFTCLEFEWMSVTSERVSLFVRVRVVYVYEYGHVSVYVRCIYLGTSRYVRTGCVSMAALHYIINQLYITMISRLADGRP